MEYAFYITNREIKWKSITIYYFLRCFDIFIEVPSEPLRFYS